MSVITYSTNVSKKAEDNQVIAAYYQENSGRVQELKYQGAVSGWKTSKPIFTDARNFTGLATFSRLNGTDRTVREPYAFSWSFSIKNASS